MSATADQAGAAADQATPRPAGAFRAALRPARTITATLVAAGLLAVATVTLIEIVLARTGRQAILVPRARLAHEVAVLSWDDPATLLGAGIAFLGGLLILALALLPRRRHVVVLESANPDVLVVTSRRMLRRLLARDATRVAGVRRARISMRRHRIAIRATGQSPANPDAPSEVEQAIKARLEQLAPVRPSVGAMHVRWKEARR